MFGDAVHGAQLLQGSSITALGKMVPRQGVQTLWTREYEHLVCVGGVF